MSDPISKTVLVSPAAAAGATEPSQDATSEASAGTTANPGAMVFFNSTDRVSIGGGLVEITVSDGEDIGLLKRLEPATSWLRYDTDRAWVRTLPTAQLESFWYKEWSKTKQARS